MSFGNPLLLLALLIVPAAVLVYWLAERRRMRYAVRYTNLDVLAEVAGGGAWRRFVPPALFLLALAIATAAIARPKVDRLVAEERATVILVVDESRSMQARDVKPTRLAAAQQAVRTFLEHAPKNLRVGLVAFSGEAHVATPPTTDHDLVRQSVNELGLFRGYGGTAIGDALQAAVALAQRATQEDREEGQGPRETIAYHTGSAREASAILAAERPNENKPLASILFLSDGAQTRGVLEPIEGAELAKDAGVPVYTIALGTPDGTVDRPFGFGGGGFGTDPTDPNSGGGGFGLPGGGGQGGGGAPGTRRIPVPPDPVTLNAIARLTGGQFSEARTAESLQAAYAKLGSSLGRRPGEVEVTNLFMGVGAAMLLAAALLSAAWSPRFP
jgi:Ca-activated chloride channel family protein